ncbi:MAG: metallophosphoesterase, partial [Burkholderiales bacterium]|nr:metallophosphoesterase [Burkholderiales bacterium]
GAVSAAQVARVAGLLAAASPGQLRVVVLHQPLGVADAAERVHVVRGHAQAAQAWARAGADVVLGGHIHLPFALPLRDLARPLWVVQAGTAVSSRTRPGVPNSVNVLRWGGAASMGAEATQTGGWSGGHCAVEQWDFSPQSHAFCCTGVTTVSPQPASLA